MPVASVLQAALDGFVANHHSIGACASLIRTPLSFAMRGVRFRLLRQTWALMGLARFG
jgi:hypothetical protein